ncbi:MAG: PAS domain S-box protein [Candidatus Cloacimonetes bacterium]|nr:PAS domain S-box protein [Candidatus Cloacimonadota bacterium]
MTLVTICISVLLLAIILLIIFWNRSLRSLVLLRTAELETDILERKQVELDLKKSEERFRLMVENAPIGIAMATSEGILMDVNQAYADILGYPREELLQGKFYEVGYPDDIEKSEKKYNELVAGAPSVRIDKRLIKKDGNVIYVSQRLVLIRDQNNQPLFVMGMSIDITERIKAVQKLKKNEELYYSVLHNMSGVVYNCANDENWTISFISGGIEKISGYPVTDFIGNRVRSYASIIHPEDKETLGNLVQEGLKNKNHYTFEYRIIHRDGRIVWVFEEGQGIFNEDGELLHLNGTIIDITERKNTELELHNYRQHLEDMVKARTKELEEKNQKLEEFNRLFVGREFRIKDLRDEIKELKRQLEEKG